MEFRIRTNILHEPEQSKYISIYYKKYQNNYFIRKYAGKTLRSKLKLERGILYEPVFI